MPKISDILTQLELVAPKRFAFEFDKVGLQVGEESAVVSKATYSLDRSLGAIEFAKEHGCQLLISHHPLIFTPLDDVTNRSHTSRSVLELARSQIAFMAAHTNWDSAQGGINDVLCDLLGIHDRSSFGSGATVSSTKLVFFCPLEAVEAILDAVSATGAGVIGSYRRCAFESAGTARFDADPSSHPSSGHPGERNVLEELRVEMILRMGTERAAEKALLKAHPYETPAYDVYPLTPRVEQPAGRVGSLEQKLSFQELVAQIDSRLNTKCYAWGDPNKKVRKIGVVGGAADGDWMHAQHAGADVFVTGEVRQHIAVEASESGLCIVAAGHYATENPGAIALGKTMSSLLPDIEWLAYEPKEGLHGRPFHS